MFELLGWKIIAITSIFFWMSCFFLVHFSLSIRFSFWIWKWKSLNRICFFIAHINSIIKGHSIHDLKLWCLYLQTLKDFLISLDDYSCFSIIFHLLFFKNNFSIFLFSHFQDSKQDYLMLGLIRNLKFKLIFFKEML